MDVCNGLPIFRIFVFRKIGKGDTRVTGKEIQLNIMVQSALGTDRSLFLTGHYYECAQRTYKQIENRSLHNQFSVKVLGPQIYKIFQNIHHVTSIRLFSACIMIIPAPSTPYTCARNEGRAQVEIPKESDPLVLKAEPSIECRLVRFLVPTACISDSDDRKG
ncbi:MAG: hypothetical protein SPK76_00200 [Bacteroidales bacterium]|nr:hypothetical protein [Bacteroidales bacterium]